MASEVISGIAAGCKLAGAALLGGETAEMPGMYQGNDLDLAGFCVGVVERDKIIDGSQVADGDRLLGLASSGPHSNGYSLIRRILERSSDALDTPLNGTSLGEALLQPTRIYVRSILKLLEQTPVHALAHITGGGLPENLARVLPGHCNAIVDVASWQQPAVFDWLQKAGNIDGAEMLRTFNCGIGMVLVVPADCAERATAQLTELGETVYAIGEIQAGTGQVQIRS